MIILKSRLNKFIILLFLLLISINVFSQIDSLNTGKYSSARKIFEKDYIVSAYSKFSKSQIKVENNKVIFSGLKSIEFPNNSDTRTKLIIESGLLDPYDNDRSYNLNISFIDDLSLLNPNPQTKRFSFWILYFGNKNPLLNSVNPTVFYFELQNENATRKTSFEDFVEGAKLTFLKNGGIIL
jgi:hypothetical protein